MIQKPAMYTFDSRNGPSLNIASPPRLSITVTALGAEAGGEDPVALGQEPVVERVDGSHLGRGSEAGIFVDYRNKILHIGSSPLFGARVGGRSPLPRTDLPQSDTASGIFFDYGNAVLIMRPPGRPQPQLTWRAAGLKSVESMPIPPAIVVQ